MIPVLYNHSEKEFTSNGLGRLTECTSCIVTEERNGVFECEFTYPISGRHYEEIAEGCIIFVTHDNSGIPQPFDVYRRSVPINGEVTFNAAHVSYRLGKNVLMPYTADSCASALSGIKVHCVPECDFVFVTDKTVEGNFNLTRPTAAKAILCGVEGSILDVFGTGEYKFDKFLVNLKLHRGTDTDVQIRYGKNLVDFTDEIDSSNTYTAVIPFWENPETGEIKMLPEGTVVAEDAPIYVEYWTDENGRRITDENGGEFEFAYSDITAVTLDLSTVFETEPTDEQMRARAQASADAHKGYKQSLTVDFVQLAQSEEYKDLAPLQELNLCDTCEVIYNNNPVRFKVIRTEYDVLKDRYSQIDLGDPPANYADVLTGEIEEKIEIVPTKTEMRSAIQTATDTIRGVNGGNVVFRYRGGKPYEILIMDTEDVETAVNVLRINMNGIGFSHSGVDGEYVTAWTLDGKFVADFITTGILSSDNGGSRWNLRNGRFDSVNKSTGGSMTIFSGGWFLSDAIENACQFAGTYTRVNGTITMTSAYMSLKEGAGFFIIGKRSSTAMIDIRSEQDRITSNVPAYLAAGGRVWEDLTLNNCALRLNSTDTTEEASIQFYSRYTSTPGYPHITIRAKNIVLSADGSTVPSSPSNYSIMFLAEKPVYVQNNLTAQTVVQRSDENLKNIWEYDTTYDDILDELAPVSFAWKEDDTSQHVGLGARQTRRIFEEHGINNAGIVVEYGDVYSINYSELAVMLLKRVQDQTKQINDLTARLERLEALINANT